MVTFTENRKKVGSGKAPRHRRNSISRVIDIDHFPLRGVGYTIRMGQAGVIYILKICCGGGLLFSNVVVSVKFEFSMKNYNKKVPSDFFFDLKNPRKAPSKFLTPQTKQIRSFRSATPVRPYYPVSLRSKDRIRIWRLRTKASSLHSYLRLAVIVFND